MIKLRQLLDEEITYRKANDIKVKPLSDMRIILFHSGRSVAGDNNPFASFKKHLGPYKVALSVVNSRDIKVIRGGALSFGEGINYAAIDIRMFL